MRNALMLNSIVPRKGTVRAVKTHESHEDKDDPKQCPNGVSTTPPCDKWIKILWFSLISRHEMPLLKNDEAIVHSFGLSCIFLAEKYYMQCFNSHLLNQSAYSHVSSRVTRYTFKTLPC